MAPRRAIPDWKPRRLIVNADDFGRSTSINQAIIRAHCEGILTASLMANEPAFEEAVALAREHPTLGVGLHLTLLCGHSALPPKQIPGLVNAKGEFTNNPASAGFRYFFQSGLREPLRREIHAQFQKFRAAGLPLDHVNGHLFRLSRASRRHLSSALRARSARIGPARDPAHGCRLWPAAECARG